MIHKNQPFKSKPKPQREAARFPKQQAQIQPRKQHQKNPNEVKYYGYHACLKLWKERPDDVIRVYIEERHVKTASALLKWCASKGKAYHIISADEMAKVSDSIHHEGLCILAKAVKDISFEDMCHKLDKKQEPCCLLYLDGVQNPHNIGSIMRVCAHFGVNYIMGEAQGLPSLSPSAYRIAQGGAESVQLVPLQDVKRDFKKLQQLGFTFLATSSHKGINLYEYPFPKRTVIVLGSESEGVQSAIMSMSKDSLLIPGTGQVESLNVSVATGLLIGEYYRQTRFAS